MANDAQMPERIWLDAATYNGAVGFAHAKRKDEGQWQEFVRSDICASGPQVRALEWGAEVKFSGQPACYSDSEFGVRMIVDHSVHGNGIKAYDEMGDSIGVFPDFDAAKAAAQAEYERRILAALTPAPQPTCRKCGGTMQPGHALAQTCTSGAPDDLGGDAQTMSAGGPGALIDCRKCEDCGWSVTPAPQPEVATPTAQEAVLREIIEWAHTQRGSYPNWIDRARQAVGDFEGDAGHPPQPSVSVAEVERAFDEIRELNMSGRDENGHRWANSDLIDQTVTTGLIALRALKGGDA